MYKTYKGRADKIEAVQYELDDEYSIRYLVDNENVKFDETSKKLEVKTSDHGFVTVLPGQFVVKDGDKIFVCNEELFKRAYISYDEEDEMWENYIKEELPYDGGKYKDFKKIICENLPKSACSILNNCGNECGIIIAGGFFRSLFLGEKPNDMDIYPESYKALQILVELYNNDPDWEKSSRTSNCYNFRNKKTGFEVDVVSRFSGEPIKILNIFDFTVTKFAYYLDSGINDYVVYHKNYFEHLFKKVLSYGFDECVEDIGFSGVKQLNRVIKYSKYGFKFDKISYLQFIKIIKSLDDDDLEAYLEADDGYDHMVFDFKNDEEFDEPEKPF